MTSVPFFSLQRYHSEIRDDLASTTARVADANMLILGPELDQFEASFAHYCGARHAVGVGNGLDALTLTLRGLGIGVGDEVIVPGATFVATWLAVTEAGADVVPVDVDPSTSNIDASRVAAALTPRTKGIIAVHLYGQPADMDALSGVAEAAGIPIIEDAAQAHGARHRERRAGSLGRAAAFSFYPTKNLGALGDGGAITTDDDGLAHRVRLLRNYGSTRKYAHEIAGVNSRLDELQAAFLSLKLPALDAKNARRRAIAATYSTELANLPGIALPHVLPNVEPVWHLFVIRAKQRDRMQSALKESGVGTQIHYPVPPHRQPAYAALSGRSLRVTESLASEVLSLPMWPEMTDEEVGRVIESVRAIALG